MVYSDLMKTFISNHVKAALCEVGIFPVTGCEIDYTNLSTAFTDIIWDLVKDLKPISDQKSLDDFACAIHKRVKEQVAKQVQSQLGISEEKQTKEFKGIQGPDGLVLRMVPGPLTQQ